jgi:hypothetical protein
MYFLKNFRTQSLLLTNENPSYVRRRVFSILPSPVRIVNRLFAIFGRCAPVNDGNKKALMNALIAIHKGFL